ncbi:MAG: YraN family protein [Christensenellales bacterium]|jgi:putative endonuclease
MNRQRGKIGEDAAAHYLEQNGYELVERNYRSVAGEIDIIARKGEKVVFVEVKARSSSRFGSPGEAVDARKQQRIRQAALCFLSEAGMGERYPLGFDVVEVYLTQPIAVRHIKNAF